MPSENSQTKVESEHDHAKHAASHVENKPAKKAGNSYMLAAGAIVVVIIVVAGLLYFGMNKASTGKSAGVPNTSVPQIGTGSTVPPTTVVALGANQITAQKLITMLDAYKTPNMFTINYKGSVLSVVPSESFEIAGNIISQYQRYDTYSRALTSESLNSANLTGNRTTAYYYSSNSLSYYCASNTTANYTCSPLTIPFNITTFGLSTLLGTLPQNLTQTVLTTANSSYNGMPCLAISATVVNTLYNDGVYLNTTAHITGCIQQAYKVPLTLDVNATDTESGTYVNGTTSTPVPTQTAIVTVDMHMVNITNSSSQLQVENLPANAIIEG